MKVIHILSGLYQGGAESQLEKLILFSKNENISHVVISLKNDKTPLMQRFRDSGITVHCVGFNGIGVFVGFFRLKALLKQLTTPTTVIQCWMYHANFFGLLAAWLIGVSGQVVWNIRRTELPKGLTGLLATLSAKLSHILPVKIICCAEAAKESHIVAGYNSANMLVIHNGIDIELFKPDNEARVNFRNEITVVDNDFVIGMVGRYAPIKGHTYLLQAFERLLIEGKNRSIKLVLVGREIETALPLQALLALPLIKINLILLAERSDISKVMPGFDLLCLPSLSEGFPNVVAEAMASGVPALVTDVGDAAIIVDNNDMVIAPADINKLTEKISAFIDKSSSEKKEISERARKLVVTQFSVEHAWQEYHELYKRIIEDN
ncbi:glycosyltransferase [Vibrio aestuarianus]|uniref:glycosyltransferase n=1 Tax=Vibrio aestuarianus TaxID=28171 RepID=UPI00237D1FC5|nr:glycosyltransferase [Vibrio aestuarianus]MDE1211672.1 glycosyltransferase [Vibrio aestuarianus]MDE1251621.1 glycosyltransferase [Vibrio aestuarianus]